jgi:hypothetical protein
MATRKFNKHSQELYRKVCRQCGTVKWVVKANLIGKDGLTRLCPRCKPGHYTTHGLSKHPIFRVWTAMIARCTKPLHPLYQYYGARGISVCDEWTNDVIGFIAWAEAHGWQQGLEIDRIDNDGNYSKYYCMIVFLV